MVSLGFFHVAGQNDLPFVAERGDRMSTAVQTDLLSLSTAVAPSSGIKPASVHNLALCASCKSLFEYPCASLYKQPQIASACKDLSAASIVGLSSEPLVAGWLAAPYGEQTVDLGQCASACADLSPYWNHFGGGYERPYGPLLPS